MPEDTRYRTEVIVPLFEDQVDMDYFSFSHYSI
nr:MAG TPA: hypothetical protein [Caudoviricetes sp.]